MDIKNNQINTNISNASLKKMNKKVAFYTLGCKVNQYESEAMSESFISAGYEVVDYNEFADYYVINTCTVTSISDRKSRQFMRRAKKTNPKAVIVVVGCYSQVAPDEVEAIEEVNLVLGTHEKKDILQYIQGVCHDSKIVHVQEIMKIKTYEGLEIEDTFDKTRVFMKIQDGCNQFCSYCIIPYARGPIRSRNPQEIMAEAKRLVKKGFKEIVLTGIHLSSYGLDIKETALIDIIEDLNTIEGLERIRLGSLEPKVITDEFLNRLQKVKKFCPQFHLSLQSGCNEILKKMNRKYTREDYLLGVEKIREIYPLAGITTDIIVGFPEETDENFLETLDFVEKIEFSKVHVFKYSKREGTPAAKMKNQVHGTVKTLRSQKLQDLVDQHEENYMKKWINQVVEVLFEEENEGLHVGLTPEYLKVEVPSHENLQGQVRKVKIIDYNQKELVGILQ